MASADLEISISYALEGNNTFPSDLCYKPARNHLNTTIRKGFREAHSASSHEGWPLGMGISSSLLQNTGGMPALGLSHGSCTPQWSSHFSSLFSISTALTSDVTESSLQTIISFMQVKPYLGNSSGRISYFSWDYSWQSLPLRQIAL